MRNAYVLFIFAILNFSSCKSDQPKQLSGEIETITLEYIRWACDCPEYVEIQYFNQDLMEDDLAAMCIFIEPSKVAKPIPEHYYMSDHHSFYLQLTGQYYVDRGIPDSYEYKTPQAPDYAKVFRYDSFKLVKKSK